MNIEKLKKLIEDETVDSLDYNLEKNYNSAEVLIKLQWRSIKEALLEDET